MKKQGILTYSEIEVVEVPVATSTIFQLRCQLY